MRHRSQIARLPGRSTGLARTGLFFALLLSTASSLPSWAQTNDLEGFTLARLKYDGGGDWYDGTTSLPNLARALKERTTIPISRLDEARVSILDPDFFNYPWIYMNGHGNVRFTDAEVARLRTYLLNGGFLFANDDYGMDSAFRREIARVFPDRKLTPIPFDHPIYHCFYDFSQGPPKIMEHDKLPSQGLGIFDGKRLLVFYVYQTDIDDGLEDPQAHGVPENLRAEAMKMAINTVVYALTRPDGFRAEVP